MTVAVIFLCVITSISWGQDSGQSQLDQLPETVSALVPMLRFVVPSRSETRTAKNRLLQWDYRMDQGSNAAVIYLVWERELLDTLTVMLVANDQVALLPVSKKSMVDWLREPEFAPSGLFGDNATVVRDNLLIESLDRAVDRLAAILNDDANNPHQDSDTLEDVSRQFKKTNNLH